MNTALLIIRSMRPHQWVKNIFIFAPMVFSLHFFQRSCIKNSLLAFFLFTLVTGCIYIFNDCFDREKDRLHPDKKKRPVASGNLHISTAVSWGIGLLLVSLSAITLMNTEFLIIALLYIFLNIFYSTYLKEIVILDVMIIAVGFVMRVKIGGAVNSIELSPWILIITFLLAIFLGLIKRRQELIKINSPDFNGSADMETRKTLKKYNLALLDQLIAITTATTLISYVIYVTHPDIQEKFHTKELYFTIPFVVFGIFRYLYLTYVKGMGENTAEIIFSDIPFSANGVAWLALFILLIVS